MHTFIKRALLGAFIGGGIAVLGAGVAHAADTTGDDGLLSGTQALLGVEAPLTIGGNAISVLGDSSSADAGTTAPAPPAPTPADSTSGDGGAGSGTQALVTVSVPVTVAGNGISVLGDSASTGAQTAAPTAPAEPTTTDTASPTTSGEDAIAGGTQAIAPITAPVTVGGNAISVIGDSGTDRSSTGGAGVGGTGVGGTGPSGSAPITAGDDSILSGTQVAAAVAAPVTVGGNAVSVLGDSASSGATSGEAMPGSAGTDGSDPATSGADSILGGTQLSLPLVAPVTVGGNSISVIGDSTTTEPVTGPANPGTTDPGTTDPGEPGDPTIPGTPVEGTDGAMLTGGLASIVGTPAGVELAQTGGNGGSALLALAVGVAAVAVGLGLRLRGPARSRR
ncbi:hypothetical protein AB2L57_17630 [Microbacterium sp. HA-8]|uniref:hypothetical protein n=1 Tax=Microbacterium sp. HA-8 TaxID=3234200 RepID=UPI0038F73212